MNPTTKKPAAKRGPGRPRKPRPTGPPPAGGMPIGDPDPIVIHPDDARAQSTADRIAAAAADAAQPSSSTTGGRPTARAASMNQLADNLATSYEAIGGAIVALSFPLSMSARTAVAGQRIREVGETIVANAVECGNALARWADTNKKVRDFLTGASGHAGMLMVIAVHLPIIGAVAGRREAGELAGTMAAGMADPDIGAAMKDAMDFASTFATMFTANGGPAATADEAPIVIDTTATEVEVMSPAAAHESAATEVAQDPAADAA